MTFSIIIPTKDRGNIFQQTIAAACIAIEDMDAEIIVINDSKTAEVKLIDANKSNIKVLNNPLSGVASARNLGASIARSSYLIFVDDDMIINKDALINSIEFIKTHTNSTYNANWTYDEKLVAEISTTQFGRYLIHYHFTSLQGWNNNFTTWEENTLLKVNGITSQFFAITKADFTKIGGYNENFPLAGFEDYEIYLKLKKNNIVNYIDTRTRIYHNELDRITPVNWLDRKERGATTRRIAVEMGLLELTIKYNNLKKMIYKLLIFLKPVLLLTLKIIPNGKIYDKLYFKMINLLLGLYIYKGYNSKNI